MIIPRTHTPNTTIEETHRRNSSTSFYCTIQFGENRRPQTSSTVDHLHSEEPLSVQYQIQVTWNDDPAQAIR